MSIDTLPTHTSDSEAPVESIPSYEEELAQTEATRHEMGRRALFEAQQQTDDDESHIFRGLE